MRMKKYKETSMKNPKISTRDSKKVGYKEIKNKTKSKTKTKKKQ